MNYYDGIGVHRQMVSDEVRTTAFRDSIMATVHPGHVVVDLGAGSGILSLFAAQAGAARVYGIERAAAAAALARRVVESNGFADRIQIVDGDAESVQLPERADVIVSEWLGVFGVDENMLHPVLIARERWLKPGGVMIPGPVTAWSAPVSHAAGAEATAFRTPVYGLDLVALAPFGPDEVVWVSEGVDTGELVAEPQALWTTDPNRMAADDSMRPFAAELSFVVDGPVNGLVTWFSAELPGTVALTNRPGARRTHWGQFLYPIANAGTARSGDRLHIGFHCVPTRQGGSEQLWSSVLNNGPREVHDTRRMPRSPTTPPWRIYYHPDATASGRGAS